MISLFELIYVVEDRDGECSVLETTAEDRARVAALAAGDRSAFNWFFSEYKDPLYRFVYRYVKEEECALDLVQESFMRLLATRDRIKPGKGVRSYLFTIALHCCYDELRKRKRCRMESLDKLVEVSGVNFEDKRNKVELKTELHELELRLEEVIEGLPQLQRDALLLKKMGSFTYEDVAGILGYSLRYVKRLTKLALDTILAALESEGLAEKGELKI